MAETRSKSSEYDDAQTTACRTFRYRIEDIEDAIRRIRAREGNYDLASDRLRDILTFALAALTVAEDISSDHLDAYIDVQCPRCGRTHRKSVLCICCG